MTLHEAVIEARYRGYNWLAIDDDLTIYAYSSKPKLSTRLWHNYSGKNIIFIGTCETILCGDFTDWLIDLEELTL